MSESGNGHLPYLDGLRGVLSLWVFAYHVSAIVGYLPAWLPPGAIAVDIFMVLSGLLMTRNFLHRGKLDWGGVKAFWLRRIFRIAPLYFLLLGIAFLYWSQFHEMTLALRDHYPPPWADRLHVDPSQPEPTPLNILAHLTFLFGLIPQFASSTPIPDWSLSLEMQFYVVLPVLVFLARLQSAVFAVWVGAVVISVWMRSSVGLYLTPTDLGLWPQPAALPFKIDCFVIGMLIALYAVQKRPSLIVMIMISGLVFNAREVAAAAVLCLIVQSEPEGVPQRLGSWAKFGLSTRVARFFGDISYAVYLAHMLVLLPVASALSNTPAFDELRPSLRFLVALCITSAIVIPISYLLHLFVEKPGIGMGRRFAGSRTMTART